MQNIKKVLKYELHMRKLTKAVTYMHEHSELFFYNLYAF